MNRRWILLILISAAVAGAAALLVRPIAPPEERPAGAPLSSMRVGRNAIYVPDQAPAGSVIVGFAVLAEPGFVVIRDDEEGPGRILGASRLLSTGETRDFAVTLDEPTSAGHYFAALYRDDGDERFEADQDAPVRDADGSAMMMRFLAAEDAEPPAAVLP